MEGRRGGGGGVDTLRRIRRGKGQVDGGRGSRKRGMHRARWGGGLGDLRGSGERRGRMGRDLAGRGAVPLVGCASLGSVRRPTGTYATS